MPTNNFKLFDQNKANILSDTEYANATQRLNGVQTGVASSQLNNKFAYQVSLVAYAIAQIMNQNGLDASDTLAVSAFVGNLGGALLQKVADKASTAEAAAGVLTNKYISPATLKAAALLLSGGVMFGTLDMNNNKITNLPTPTSNSEPATKEYVDGWNVGYTKIGTLTNGSGGAGGGTWNDLDIPFNGTKVVEFIFHFKDYKLTDTSYGTGAILFGYPSNKYFGTKVIGKDTTTNTFNGVVKSFPYFIDNSKNSGVVNEIQFNNIYSESGAKDLTYTKVTMQGISTYSSGSIDIYAKLVN